MWCLLLFAILQLSCAEKWDYGEDYGPSKWAETYPTCGESSQSPIDIKDVEMKNMTGFYLTSYEYVKYTVVLENDGHTAKMYLSDNNIASQPYFKGGGLNGEYEFLQLHFHWGKTSTTGSEHTLYGKQYPLEVHLVHWKKSYGSVKEALKKPDGLAVLGVLFQLANIRNYKLKSLFDHLYRIKNSGAEFNPFLVVALRDFLPSKMGSFYRYNGSLTTPPCSEAVVWTVFEDVLSISESQLEQLRALLDEDKNNIVDNFRPVQSLNNRKIYKRIVPPRINIFKILLNRLWEYFASLRIFG